MKNPDRYAAAICIRVRPDHLFRGYSVGNSAPARAAKGITDLRRYRMLRGLSPNGYFFLPLDVFFAVFLAAFAVFAFFAFLAMFASASWLNANRPSTCMDSEYTIIAKLIPRASKTVNDGHTVATCESYRRKSKPALMAA
jgi:hypothetical protein